MDDKTFVNRLIDSGIARFETIVPCSDREVKFVEESFGFRLPEVYRSFLLAAGKCAGRFLAEYDAFYPEILSNRKEAIEKLELWESESLTLPPDAFVFSFRPAEQFCFFLCESSAHTETYWYFEGRGRFQKVSNSFWEWIESHLNASERILKKHPGRDEDWLMIENVALKRANWVKSLEVPPVF